MHKKLVLFLLSSFMVFQLNCLNYMNDEDISFATFLTGSRVKSIYYNILNNGDGTIGGARRFFGIHNMSVTVDGYETIDLIKDDVCMYPYLFTILSNFLSDNNIIVQRWACVKWLLPLSFGFKVENNHLTILSTILRYRFLSLCRAKETILLTEKMDVQKSADKDLLCTVNINGQSVVVSQATVLQVTNSMMEYARYSNK